MDEDKNKTPLLKDVKSTINSILSTLDSKIKERVLQEVDNTLQADNNGRVTKESLRSFGYYIQTVYSAAGSDELSRYALYAINNVIIAINLLTNT